MAPSSRSRIARPVSIPGASRRGRCDRSGWPLPRGTVSIPPRGVPAVWAHGAASAWVAFKLAVRPYIRSSAFALVAPARQGCGLLQPGRHLRFVQVVLMDVDPPALLALASRGD